MRTRDEGSCRSWDHEPVWSSGSFSELSFVPLIPDSHVIREEV